MRILPFVLYILVFDTFACEVKVLNSCRDSYTKNISKGRTRSAKQFFETRTQLKRQLDDVFQKITPNWSHQDFLNNFLRIEELGSEFTYCQSVEENSKTFCLNKVMTPVIYYGYATEELDASATILLLTKVQRPAKAAFTGELSSYAKKIELLRKSYEKNQEVSAETSPLSKPKYLKRFGKLRRLTPRQHTLFKYNYSQIKFMGKMMQEFEKDIVAMRAGLFYDYDGDGDADKTIEIDEAEKYRMTVKLLLLELEKKSQSTEIFSGRKPDFHDLLVASNELGLISDQDLDVMIELPFLYEEKTTFWQKAKKITWEIGKGVVMAIPGVNLYSIIPIVLVESYGKAKEKKNETSDFHLFTF